MNEFTKEELKILEDAMVNLMQNNADKFLSLIEKIQRMIETYDTPQAIRERTEQHGGGY